MAKKKKKPTKRHNYGREVPLSNRSDTKCNSCMNMLGAKFVSEHEERESAMKDQALVSHEMRSERQAESATMHARRLQDELSRALQERSQATAAARKLEAEAKAASHTEHETHVLKAELASAFEEMLSLIHL